MPQVFKQSLFLFKNVPRLFGNSCDYNLAKIRGKGALKKKKISEIFLYLWAELCCVVVSVEVEYPDELLAEPDPAHRVTKVVHQGGVDADAHRVG